MTRLNLRSALGVEQRSAGLEARVETREADDAGELRFTGHASVFDQPTWIGPKRWGFWEVVDRGFFDDVLQDRAAFLVNHDPSILLARNGSTMTLSTDDVGLVPDARWDANDPEAQMWAGRVNRGDANEMSFAFTVKEEAWAEDSDTGEETRTLLKAEKLYDVSLVTYPAYAGTDGSMRDQAAEVIMRHRGYDPRLESRDHNSVRLGLQRTHHASVAIHHGLKIPH
jgi:HK97 family phage prohead protease